jgi:4'-phosphopantetheinyl transferase
LTSIVGWVAPPEQPALGAGEAAVWRVPSATEHPIESIAALYLGCAPASVRVTRGEAGKPELEGSELAVSLTHSGDAVLVAVALGGEVGVDAELLRPDAAGWRLVDHALTASERARLDAVPAPDRAESFLRIWTRKEAILKAAGTGLGIDPRRVDLDGLDVVALPAELGPAGDWTLVDVPLPDYAAALARRGALDGVFLYDGRARSDPAQPVTAGTT